MSQNEKKTIYIFLIIIIILSSILIYKIEKTTNYDKNMYEQVYKEYEQITNISTNKTNIDSVSSNSSKRNNTIYVFKNSTGDTYTTIGVIEIPKINISYPIIKNCTDANLNIAPAKLVGPDPNTKGNLVIMAHNNWNREFFSNLNKLENEDIVQITDNNGNKLSYKVYDKYQIKQDDFSCLNQNTNGKTELTLITCIKYQKNKRLVVKCVAI